MVNTRVIVIGGLFVVVFLVSFVPEYIKASRSDSTLSQAQQGQRMSSLRDLSALMYFQATQKNYGLAAGTAAQFFSRVGAVAGQSPEPQRKAILDLLSPRDRITAGLAKGDPAVVNDLGVLFEKTRRATGLSD